MASRVVISLVVQGDQMTQAFSSISLIMALYALILASQNTQTLSIEGSSRFQLLWQQ